MSTKGIRDFRPQLHYTPIMGWINDPNGLVCVDGVYHLFSQYDPDVHHTGPLFWDHAVSRDLIHWEHLPIALTPDLLGSIFSGSAVYDKENTSGFGKDGKAPIVAMFTYHHSSEDGDHSHDYEQQAIAYSTDGVNFTKYEGNPVLPGRERDFRDPKVFPNPVKGGWSVATVAGDRVRFYHSADLKNWEKTGEFGPEGNYSLGVWECPDIFPLEINGETKWVLLVSMGPSRENRGSRTQYFIGDFDGDTFTCDGRFDQVEFIDDGFDNYAGVTFSNTDERILVGWASNWVYATKTPTYDYCGCQTIPRVISLVDTPLGGVRLASKPVSDGFFDAGKPSDGTLPGEVFKLTVTGSGAASVTLGNDKGQTFVFGVNEANEVFIDRRNAGAKDFSEIFADDWFSENAVPRFYDGAWKLELTFDHSVAELFADGGTRTFTLQLYPDTPYTAVTAEENAKITVHTLKSAE